jgi:ring-1,2-phenylacetyl-CoA epoxidase subunit PaaE
MWCWCQAQEDDSIFGRIEKSTVNLILKNKHKDLSIDAFYLCGPEAMIYTVKDVLAEHHTPRERVFFELFKAAKPTATETAAIPDGQSEITILLDDETTTFTMSQKQTILEAALDKDLDAPYSCQGGICSSCLARVTEGEVKMRQNNILTDGEVADGLILTCQAHPLTSNVSIDYDDI